VCSWRTPPINVICSTNAIGVTDRRYRRAIKARGPLPSQQAALSACIS
jgi:transposase-like protein